MLLAPLLDSIGTLLGVMYGDIGCCGSDAMDLASWRYSLSTQSAVGGGEAFKGLASVASVYPPPPHGWRREPLPWPELGW
jgi:hypothetical protein